MDQPNVLLVSIDTLRWDSLGCYGSNGNHSPQIDRLASTALRFDQAITGGSWTQAAFPVIMTSTHASMYGGCLGPLAPARPSPVEALAAYGYTTVAFSTNPHLSKRSAYDRGFQQFFDLTPVESAPRLREMKGGQRLLRSSLFHTLLRPTGKRMRPARLYSPAAEVTNSFSRWLDQAQTPFFAWLHYMDLHWPYHLEESLDAPHDIAQAWQDLAIMHARSNFDREKPLTTAQRDRFVDLYTRSLRYLDTHIGRLPGILDSAGVGANTIIILLSDHGEEFLDHGRWGHWESNLFDEIVRVPLIIHLPGLSAGQVIPRQVRLLDLMPTILELCGCARPQGLLGASLQPLWAQREAEYKADVAITEMRRDPWHRIAMRTEEFKYIWDNKRPDEPELYALRTDPRETQPVNAAYPQVVGRFQFQVAAHLRHVAQSEPQTAVTQLEFDELVARRLRDLGYVE